MTPPGVITEGLMMTPLEKSLEELELIGEENVMKRRGGDSRRDGARVRENVYHVCTLEIF